MSDATFGCPDLTTFCRLEELGLEVIGQRLDPDRASWPAGSSNRISGAAAATTRAPRPGRGAAPG